MKQRLVRVLGSYYYKTIPQEEFTEMVDKLVVNLDHVNMTNESELEDFLSLEMQKREADNLPLWKLYLKEDYQEEKSLFILKVHHSLCDGQALVALLGNICDNSKELNEMALQDYTIPFFNKVLMYLSMPYYIFKMFFKTISFNDPNNPLSSLLKEMSGVRECKFSKEYSLSEFRAKWKKLNVSLNDIFMTAISVTLKEYFLSQEDNKTHEVLAIFPVYLSPTSEVNFSNNVASHAISLPLFSDFQTGLSYISREMKAVKASGAPLGPS